jgi:putative spermidine/putrescine transport system substrate-binding protein
MDLRSKTKGRDMFKTVGRNTCAAAILFVSLLVGSDGAFSETLVIYGWVGPNEAGFRKEFFPAFEKKYGAKIEYLSASSFLNYGKLKAERNNPQADVALFDDMILDQARKEDLLQPLDTSIVQNLSDIAPDARFKDNMGVGVGPRFFARKALLRLPPGTICFVRTSRVAWSSVTSRRAMDSMRY